MHRKIAGPMRVQSNGGSALDFKLDPRGGGAMVKSVLYSIKIIQSSDSVTVGMLLATGPDGDTFGNEKEILAPTQPGAAPSLLQGSSGTPDTVANDTLNQWLRLTLKCGVVSGTNDEWAVVEVYETRKYS